MSVRGVAIEGVSDQGGPVRPVALVAEGKPAHYAARGYETRELLARLVALSDTGGDLVTYGVDYFTALLLRDAPPDALAALWKGERVSLWGWSVSLVPTLYLWLYDPASKLSCRVSDIRRWGADTLPETCALFGVESPALALRWELRRGHEPEALALAAALAAVYGGIARELDAAFGRANLPRYWRDGTGRVAGALLDKMATPADIAPYPAALRKPIQTAYYGGRINVATVGRWERVSQLDIRSAYPHAMAALPSLHGATWKRARAYDPARPWALWLVRWEVAHGARIGPFPVRRSGQVLYPLAGSGWYWADEVAAAIEVFGAGAIRPEHGFYCEPASDRRPFAGIAAWYDRRASLRDSGDRAAAHALKLTLTSMYGRLAQEATPDGGRGRWANLALAGMVTSATRARMLRLFADHWNDAVAIATDSLTVRGGVGAAGSRNLGGLQMTTGDDAILLPSGAYHVASGDAQIDRMAGIDRNRSRLVDWRDVRASWDILGLALSYHLSIPYFVGIGMAANGAGRDYCRWRMVRRDIAGGSYYRKATRTGYREWDLLPERDSYADAEMYVPRPGVLSRLPDQGYIPIGDVIVETSLPG